MATEVRTRANSLNFAGGENPKNQKKNSQIKWETLIKTETLLTYEIETGKRNRILKKFF